MITVHIKYSNFKPFSDNLFIVVSQCTFITYYTVKEVLDSDRKTDVAKQFDITPTALSIN